MKHPKTNLYIESVSHALLCLIYANTHNLLIDIKMDSMRPLASILKIINCRNGLSCINNSPQNRICTNNSSKLHYPSRWLVGRRKTEKNTIKIIDKMINIHWVTIWNFFLYDYHRNMSIFTVYYAFYAHIYMEISTQFMRMISFLHFSSFRCGEFVLSYLFLILNPFRTQILHTWNSERRN